MARRGCPALVISDNGSSFIADETQEFAANHLIKWQFNVACSRWMGGIWERLVSCVKKCFEKEHWDATNKLYRVEVIPNNRHICADYDDDIDEVLTPNHLIFGRRLEMTNFPDMVKMNVYNNQEYDQSFNNENEGEPNAHIENEVMIVRRTPKRNAAIIGKIKRRYIDSD